MDSARTISFITRWLYWHRRSLISVLRRARPAVHSRRKRSPQAYSSGSALSRRRMAVSAPRSDERSIFGARGEAHAKEWPGAMMPALPPVASSPSASFSSTSVTSWPALARKYAVVTPTTPPPSTSVFMAARSFGQLDGLVHEHGVAPRLAAGVGGIHVDDRGLAADLARQDRAADEGGGLVRRGARVDGLTPA